MKSPVQDRLDRLTAALTPGTAADADATSDAGTGLALSVATVGGEHYSAGELVAVPLAGLAGPVVHALAVEDLGVERVGEAVGTVPRPDLRTRLELEPGTGRPLTPLQDAGTMALAALVKGRGGRDRAARLLQQLAGLIGRETAPTDAAVRAADRAQHRARAAAWLLRSVGVLEADPDGLLADVATLRAAPVTVADLALLAGTLAAHGVHPVSGERVLAEETVRAVLSALDACGMDTVDGAWALDVGQPGWSSSRAGTVIAVVPGHMGIAVQGPADPDDADVPSPAALAALRTLVRDFELHPSQAAGSPRAAFRTHYRVDQAPSGSVRSAEVLELLSAHGDTAHVLELGGHVGFSQVDALAHVARNLPAALETIIVDVRSVSSTSHAASVLAAQWFAYALHHGLDVVVVDRDTAAVDQVMAAAEASGVTLPDPLHDADDAGHGHQDLGPAFRFFDSRSRAVQWAEQRLLARHAPHLLPASEEEAAMAPLLQHLSSEDARLLESMMDERVYEDGQIIRRAGQPFGGIYVITSGRVELTGQGTAGRRVRRTVLTPGMTFGEMALGQPGRQPSTVRARGRVTTRVLTAQVMYALQEGFPSLALTLWEALARDAYTALGQLIRETGALQD